LGASFFTSSHISLNAGLRKLYSIPSFANLKLTP
jgi:hypothetical protein